MSVDIKTLTCMGGGGEGGKASYIVVFIKILFEFTRFFKRINCRNFASKIEFISRQAGGAYIRGGGEGAYNHNTIDRPITGGGLLAEGL